MYLLFVLFHFFSVFSESIFESGKQNYIVLSPGSKARNREIFCFPPALTIGFLVVCKFWNQKCTFHSLIHHIWNEKNEFFLFIYCFEHMWWVNHPTFKFIQFWLMKINQIYVVLDGGNKWEGDVKTFMQYLLMAKNIITLNKEKKNIGKK